MREAIDAAARILAAFPPGTEVQISIGNPDSPTAFDLAAMRRVANGADVTSRSLAASLRRINRLYPGLVIITEPQGEYDVREAQPYLGAILTDAGRAACGLPPHDVEQP
jgi:hypothetical protein